MYWLYIGYRFGYIFEFIEIQIWYKQKQGVSSNEWIEFVREWAKNYKLSKQPATEQAKDTKHAKGTTGGKHTKGTRHAATSKEEAELKQWKNRQEEAYRKSSHSNMKRSGEIAQKAEAQHLARKNRANS